MARDFFNGSNPTAIEMLSYIDENFFKRVDTKRKLMNFTRAFLDKFCEERNLAPVTLTSVEYKYGHYATYMHYSGQLKVNNLLVKSFAEFKEKNNFFYVQEYFDTILHELRHHEQFVGALKDAHPIVKNTMQICAALKGKKFLALTHTFSTQSSLTQDTLLIRHLKATQKFLSLITNMKIMSSLKQLVKLRRNLTMLPCLKTPIFADLNL